MTILIAPDKFKGSLSARAVAAAIARGVRRVYPAATIIEQPLADGGEGSLELLRELYPLKTRRLEVTGPLRRPVQADYLLGEGKAFIEVAKACGLQHVPPARRDPGFTTTIGVGQLIEDALVRGARDLQLFLGGSATNDCGAGMAAALGYRFFSDRPNDFVPSGDSLQWVRRIDKMQVSPLLTQATITGVCDVDNPLLGPAGATRTYALQKGATPDDLSGLEKNMTHFADCIAKDLGVNVRRIPGGGAAGGLGAGIFAFLDGDLYSGIDLLLEAVNFDELVQDADLVITGEGKIDEQTTRGKVVSGVAAKAKGKGARVIALSGVCTLLAPATALPNVDKIASIMEQPGMSQERAMREAAELLEKLVEEILSEEAT